MSHQNGMAAAAEAGRQQMPGIAQAQAAFREGFI
jgi:hypothetical protein